MTASSDFAALRTPGGSDPAIVFPARRARIAIHVVHGFVFALIAAFVWVVATEPTEWPLGIQTHATTSDAWAAVGVGWVVVWALVLFDGKHLRAGAAGVTIRARIHTALLPWSAIAGISSTGTGLRFALVDGGSQTFELVSRSLAARAGMWTSPMVDLAERLDRARTTAAAAPGPRPTARVRAQPLALTTAEWAQIGGMLGLLAAVAYIPG